MSRISVPGPKPSFLANLQLIFHKGVGFRTPLGGHLTPFQNQTDYTFIRVHRIKMKKRLHQGAVPQKQQRAVDLTLGPCQVSLVRRGLVGKAVQGVLNLNKRSLHTIFPARLPACIWAPTHLLIACNASIDSCIYDAIQAHAEQVDVAMYLLVLILADQGPQLLILILNHLDGILQRAHLHLEHIEQCHPGLIMFLRARI